MMDLYRLLPSYWLQNQPTSPAWDKALNAMLDAGPITDIGEYTVRVGGVLIWIGNWPYAFGTPYGKGAIGLPRVSTRKRLRHEIALALLAETQGCVQ